MKKYSSILLTLLVGSFCFSQRQKTTNNTVLPVSIYTVNFEIKSDNNPSYSSIKKNLKLPNKYTKFSFEQINSGQFLISDDNLGTNSTKLIYDDYKSYRDEQLLKGFLKKYDLTRWEPSNFRQPKVN